MNTLTSVPAVPFPREEKIIYIEYTSRGDHHLYDSANDTAEERRPVRGREVWLDAGLIPQAPPPLAPYPPPAVVPPITPANVVAGVGDLGPFVQVPGNPYRFQVAGVPNPFGDMVPANYYRGAYAPALRDATGAAVPYEPATWVADGLLGVLEFKYQTPSQLGYAPPFFIDYWQYRGRFAGDALVIQNEGVGAEVYDTATSFPGVAFLRRIRGDPDPGGPFSGIRVDQNPTNIALTNTLTGANLYLSEINTGHVFAQKNTGAYPPALEFRTLVAGSGVSLNEDATTITVSATGQGGGLSGLENIGGPAGLRIYAGLDPLSPTTALIRELNAGPGIALAYGSNLAPNDSITISAVPVNSVCYASINDVPSGAAWQAWIGPVPYNDPNAVSPGVGYPGFQTTVGTDITYAPATHRFTIAALGTYQFTVMHTIYRENNESKKVESHGLLQVLDPDGNQVCQDSGVFHLKTASNASEEGVMMCFEVVFVVDTTTHKTGAYCVNVAPVDNQGLLIRKGSCVVKRLA